METNTENQRGGMLEHLKQPASTGLPTTHTAEEDFQHFLSYSGLRTKEYVDDLRKAFFAGAA